MKRHRGTAIVEAVIALPILLVVILGVIQFALVYQAKATLNHAALQAARAGAVSSAAPDAIRRGLARGLAPLYSPDSSLQGFGTTVARIDAALLTDARFRILNPTRQAFEDFAEEADGLRELPNDRLHLRSSAIGAASGVNLQDANILKLEVTYGYELKVPLVNGFISRVLLLAQGGRATNGFEQQLLRRMRLPIVAAATVRMQSPARMSDLIASRDDLPDPHRIPSDGRPPPAVDQQPDDNQNPNDDGRPAAGQSNADSNLADGFLGFGSGHIEPAGEEDDAREAADRGDDIADGVAGDEAPPGETTPLCTPVDGSTRSETEGQGGVSARIWRELRNLGGAAAEFAQGFWSGIKDQLGDLMDLIASPIETAKGLYRLAQSFIEDPVTTAQLIGEALGKDLTQLAHCGAYDRGQVLGSYISPAFMLKLTTKLANFRSLPRSLDELKKDFGCASFVAGTPVWTAGGTRPIEQLNTGDPVTSRDSRSYDDSEREIERTFARDTSRYYALQTPAEAVHVTEEHPFWVQGRGWTPVHELRVGDSIATASGDVLVLQVLPVDSFTQVFNLSVPETESYFVGRDALWVHNANCDIPTPYRAPKSPSGYQVGASDGGSGQWVERGRPDSAAYRYQQQITGAPRNGTRIPEYQVSGVDFDGYDAQRNVLIDAKHYTEVCPLADCKPEFLRGRIADELVRQALAQINAVRNSMRVDTPIEWHVANRAMAEKIRLILMEGLPQAQVSTIVVVHTADLVN